MNLEIIARLVTTVPKGQASQGLALLGNTVRNRCWINHLTIVMQGTIASQKQSPLHRSCYLLREDQFALLDTIAHKELEPQSRALLATTMMNTVRNPLIQAARYALLGLTVHQQL